MKQHHQQARLVAAGVLAGLSALGALNLPAHAAPGDKPTTSSKPAASKMSGGKMPTAKPAMKPAAKPMANPVTTSTAKAKPAMHATMHKTMGSTRIGSVEAGRIAVKHIGGGGIVGRTGLRGGVYVIHVHKGRMTHQVYVGTRTGRIVQAHRSHRA